MKQRQAAGFIIALYLRKVTFTLYIRLFRINKIIVGAASLPNCENCSNRFPRNIFTRTRNIIITHGDIINVSVFRNAEKPNNLCVWIRHSKSFNFKAVTCKGSGKWFLPRSNGRPFIRGQLNIGLLHIILIHAIFSRTNRSKLGLVLDQIICNSFDFQGFHFCQLAGLRRRYFFRRH